MSVQDGIRESLRQVLSDLAPFKASDEAHELLVRWTKYNRLEGLFPVNLGEGLSLVAVRSPGGRVGIVLRTLEEQVPLDAGKTFNRYVIDGVQFCDEATARQVLRDATEAFEARALAEMEGFGTQVVNGVALGDGDDVDPQAELEALMQA